jgi:hypothetical protein
MASVCGSDWTCVLSNIDSLAASSAPGARSGGGGSSSGPAAVAAAARGEMALDLDSWQQIGFPAPVLAAVVACKSGVKRAHLVDSEADGALLLELYTRDGEGSGSGGRGGAAAAPLGRASRGRAPSAPLHPPCLTSSPPSPARRNGRVHDSD